MGSVCVSIEHLHSVLGWRGKFQRTFAFNRGCLQLMLDFCIWCWIFVFETRTGQWNYQWITESRGGKGWLDHLPFLLPGVGLLCTRCFSAFSSVVLKVSRDMPCVSFFRQVFHNLLYFTVRNLFLQFDLNFSFLKYIPFAEDLLPWTILSNSSHSLILTSLTICVLS